MNETTDKLIRDLAEKLGTTAEHLWGVLVKQAPLWGWTQVVAFSVLFTALGVAALLLRKIEDDENQFYAWLWWAVAAFVVGVVFVGNSSLIIASFANPEYWALKQIIK